MCFQFEKKLTPCGLFLALKNVFNFVLVHKTDIM